MDTSILKQCVAVVVLVCFFTSFTTATLSYNITTFAGGSGEFVDPQKLAKLSNGDIIVSDATGNSLYKISIQTKTITRIAGTGTAGLSGDGGPAVAAKLNKPYGIAVTALDEIYFADSRNHRIRKIDIYGNISTVVGTSSGFSGDGGFGYACQLNTPMDVTFTNNGDMLIADMYNHRVRKVSMNGMVSTVFGSGASDHTGDGGPASNAAFGLIYGVRAYFNGDVYISDSDNFRVRRVDAGGIINTVAGSGKSAYNGDNIPAVTANLFNPSDVAMLSSGELLIADADNHRVRLVLTNGTIVTIAGTGSAAFSGDNGYAENAGVGTVPGLLVIPSGILLTDSSNARVRILTVRGPFCYGKRADDSNVCNGFGKCIADNQCACDYSSTASGSCLPPSQYISTFAGGNNEFVDPQKLAKLSNGDVIVSDAFGHSIYKISNKVITRIAGNGQAGSGGDNGPATSSQLNKPYGIAVSPTDEIYIADSMNHRIRKIDASGKITTVVGTSGGFSGDGAAANASQLNTPMDVAYTSTGELLIADMYNHRIRKVFVNGTISTVFGSGASGNIGDGGPASNAAFGLIYGVRATANGDVYISDSDNFKVRKVDGATGIITTVAGSGSGPYNGDDQLATNANLNHPSDVLVLPTGEFLIADADNYRIRYVLLDGKITTFAGTGVAGFSGDNGLAKNAQTKSPTGILMLEPYGILITDTSIQGNGRIRLLSATSMLTCYGISSSDQGVCGGKGSCFSKDNCTCNDGWSGAQCDKPSCVLTSAGIYTPCSGKGKCSKAGTCSCDSGYYGSLCTFSMTFETRDFTHPILGVFMGTSVSSATNETISNIEYTWKQESGSPAITNLATITNLNGPNLVIPGKFDSLSFDNGLVGGNTYTFSVSIKVSSPSFTETFTASKPIAVQKDHSLKFMLQDANTGQNITSGTAGTTLFKLAIIGDDNPYSDPALSYGFGYSDGSKITILTDLSQSPGVFSLPFLPTNPVEIYVGCFGAVSVSVQKLTTISLGNPVSNLPAAQAITQVSSLVTSNSSASDLLNVASLLNTITTNDANQISSKATVRNTIINSISNMISKADLAVAYQALQSVSSTAGELTQNSASNLVDALIASTKNSQFSRSKFDGLIGVASNAFRVATGSPNNLASAIGAALLSGIQNGDSISSSSPTFAMAVAKGASSLNAGNAIKFGSTTRFLGCFLENDLEKRAKCLGVYLISKDTSKKNAGGRAVSPYNIISALQTDILPMYDNGTISLTATYSGFVEISYQYTGTNTPLCGKYDGTTISLDAGATLTKQGTTVTCKTKNLVGNVLIASNVNTSTPKKSTQIASATNFFIGKMVLVLIAIVMLFQL